MQAAAQQSPDAPQPVNHICGFDRFLEHLHITGKDYIEGVIEPIQRRNEAAQAAGAFAKTTAPVYDIPVVFHIVYPSSKPSYNIPDSVLQNQIKILNDAYRKRHSDTGLTRSVFKPLSADAEIQFHLATKDPQGGATNGITRTASPRLTFGDQNNSFDTSELVKKTANGGKDPWPTDKYLNVWVCDMYYPGAMGAVLGYATPPLNPVPSNWPAGAQQAFQGLVDGVVLQVHTIGSNNPLAPGSIASPTNTRGRTAVHEIGHYLGLMHVFGTNSGGCDCSAAAGDGISDTPPQCTISQTGANTCPPITQNSCGAGTTGDLVDNWENYMDYSPEKCQTMFTKGQIDLMRGVLANQRDPLTAGASAVAFTPRHLSVGLYPNPASTQLTIDYTDKIDHISIRNLLGQEVLQLDGRQQNRRYDISNLQTGQYILVMDARGDRYVSKFSVIR